MRASVIVPTYRRPALLRRALASLAAQDFRGSYEIIVCDDGACAETRAAAEKAAAMRSPPAVRYLSPAPRRGPAVARNAGAVLARGEVLAFTDDDCVLALDWLRRGVERIESGCDAVSGRIVMPLPPVPTDYELNASGLSSAEFATANCFVRRDAFRAAGGFDERFTRAWREDSDLQFRLLERGFALAREPRAVVVHPVRPSPPGISLRQQRNNFFEALLFKNHPSLYRSRIAAAPPWRYYAAVTALAASGAFTAAGRPAAAAAAFAAWAALTADFCRRRLARTSRRPAHAAEMAVTSALIPPAAVFWRLAGAVRFRTPFL